MFVYLFSLSWTFQKYLLIVIIIVTSFVNYYLWIYHLSCTFRFSDMNEKNWHSDIIITSYVLQRCLSYDFNIKHLYLFSFFFKHLKNIY